MAVCIKTGDIVWIYGPFPCGRYTDLVIFRRRLKHMLDVDEMVEADDGYPDEKVRRPNNFRSHSDRRAKKNARARHETINKRLKDWKVLGANIYRHRRQSHKYVFKAVAVCTQISFENGDPPFQVQY